MKKGDFQRSGHFRARHGFHNRRAVIELQAQPRPTGAVRAGLRGVIFNGAVERLDDSAQSGRQCVYDPFCTDEGGTCVGCPQRCTLCPFRAFRLLPWPINSLLLLGGFLRRSLPWSCQPLSLALLGCCQRSLFGSGRPFLRRHGLKTPLAANLAALAADLAHDLPEQRLCVLVHTLILRRFRESVYGTQNRSCI